MVKITNFKSAFMGTNMYVLECHGHVLLIDPIPNPCGNELNESSLEAIYLTHEHYDHICGVEQWRERYHCPIYAGGSAKKGLENPRLNLSHYGSGMFEIMFPGDTSYLALGELKDYSCIVDGFLEDDEHIKWEGNDLVIYHTPGHSKGSICILLNGESLFCGDTLLEYLPTGVRWKGGSEKEFRGITIPKLKALSPETVVYPGHGDIFRLKDYKYWEQTT